MVDRIESSIKKFIKVYDPYVVDGFIGIDPYILWNKYHKRYGINIFYIFDDQPTNEVINETLKHYYDLIYMVKMSMPFTKELSFDVFVKTKEQYEKYVNELIPKIKSLIPEQRMRINEEKYTEEYFDKTEKMINRFMSKYRPFSDDNFIGYKAIIGKEIYSDFLTVKLTGVFENPYSRNSSDTANHNTIKLIRLLRDTFPFLKGASITGGSTSTNDSYIKNIKYEKRWLGRDVVESKTPYKQTIKDGIKTRKFNQNIDEHELKWHRDERDRVVKIVEGNGWKFQMDNELPITLKEGDRITIPSETYHRVIRGTGDLIIKIKEL